MKNIKKIIKSISVILLEILKLIKKVFIKIIEKIWNKYLAATLSWKIISLNVILAFFAIILPAAKFKIFGANFNVNNPLAVYLMVIVIIMFASLYIKKLWRLLARVIINLYYLFWIIYLPLAGELTKAEPYKISPGYYLNIAVPVIFVIAASWDYFSNND